GSWVSSKRRVILLPQFVLPDEVGSYDILRDTTRRLERFSESNSYVFQIATYTSAALVGRLMPIEWMFEFANRLSERIRVKLIIFGATVKTMINPNVEFRGQVSRSSFLSS